MSEKKIFGFSLDTFGPIPCVRAGMHSCMLNASKWEAFWYHRRTYANGSSRCLLLNGNVEFHDTWNTTDVSDGFVASVVPCLLELSVPLTVFYFFHSQRCACRSFLYFVAGCLAYETVLINAAVKKSLFGVPLPDDEVKYPHGG